MMKSDLPQGFRAGAAAAGFKKPGRNDIGLIVSDRPAVMAALFTTNAFKAAPVQVGQEILARYGTARAVLANSGQANACTGREGIENCRETQRLVAEAVGVQPHEIVPLSTGVIGAQLKMDLWRAAVPALARSLGTQDAEGFTRAFMTTDAFPKFVTRQVRLSGGEVRLAGMAKGAGMIEPGMATMFGLIATDAEIAQPLLQKCLWNAVGQSFNCVTVDGDMSTNDTVLVLADGESGVRVSEDDAGTLALFKEALNAVTFALARKIVGDGEKISRVVTLRVFGARSAADANRIARSIGNSLLVKASWCGGDPNWGRLLCAAGYAKCGIDQTKIDLFYDDVPVFLKGELQAQNEAAWRRVVREKEFEIRMHLNLGVHDYRLISTDLTEAYVDFNKGE